MPWYLREIPHPYCQSQGCNARATVTLVNAVNSEVGDYCKEHGEQELAAVARREKDVRTAFGPVFTGGDAR